MSGDTEKMPAGRKQWIRFTGSRAAQVWSFDRYLAEDGCADSQAVLAKQLLEEKCDGNMDQEQNDVLGVYWLLKASEQGHKEATAMLEKCLRTGRGINKHNIGDVKNCLEMSHEEKVSRHAAREIFASLSQGTDFITSEQLFDAMETAEKYGSRCKEINSVQSKTENEEPSTSNTAWFSQPSSSHGEKLTEDMLVSAASHHSRGELPIVHRILMVKKTNFPRSQSFIYQSVFSPIYSIKDSYQSLIDRIGKCSITSLFPLNAACLQTLAVLAVYSFLGFDGIIEALPSWLYFTTLAIMLITTCQVLTKKWEFDQLKQWSNLLVAWGGPEVNAEEAQWNHCSNNIYPCYIFLLSLICNILLTPLVPIYTIPYSELVVVSTICAFITLYNFAWNNKGKFDYLAILSFGLSALARHSPYDEEESVPSISLSYLNFIIPSIATSILGDKSLWILLYVAMFGILLRMAVRDRRRGIYRTLLPHLISLSWWQMAIIASNGATTFGIVKNSIVVVVTILILPLTGLAIICLPIIVVVKFFMATDEILYESTTFGAACLFVLAMLYFGSRRSFTGKLISKVQICFGIVSAIILVYTAFVSSPAKVYMESSSLSWAKYQSDCSFNGIEIKALAQEKCVSLTGLHIQWEGIVQSTRITNVYNPLSNIVSKLPFCMQRVISCMYGERYYYGDNCQVNCDEGPYSLLTKCHLSNWNRYEYEIVVKMESPWYSNGTPVVLKADNVFKNFTTSLSEGDKIWFSGTLEIDPLVNEMTPSVLVHQAGCHSCDKNPPVVVRTYFADYTPFQAVSHLFYFLFDPGFTLK